MIVLPQDKMLICVANRVNHTRNITHMKLDVNGKNSISTSDPMQKVTPVLVQRVFEK
jgi:hypothetical protein